MFEILVTDLNAVSKFSKVKARLPKSTLPKPSKT